MFKLDTGTLIKHLSAHRKRILTPNRIEPFTAEAYSFRALTYLSTLIVYTCTSNVAKVSNLKSKSLKGI